MSLQLDWDAALKSRVEEANETEIMEILTDILVIVATMDSSPNPPLTEQSLSGGFRPG